MTHVLPVVSISPEFTTTGLYDPFLDTETGALIPLVRPVSKWSMQVSGLLANNTAGSLSSWTVYLMGSIDGIYFNTNNPILTHANGTNNNGDVVWPTVSTISPFRDIRFIRLNVTVALNAATKIRVSVRGF